MSVHPDDTSIYRTGNNGHTDIPIYGVLSLRSKHSQSKAQMFQKYYWLTDTYRWPIYRQSSQQIPSHWWPDTYTDPGPPPWFDQYGGSHLLVISQYLKMAAQTLRHQNTATVRMFVVFCFYLIPETEHVHPCTMWWLGVGRLQRDSWGPPSCWHWHCNLSSYKAAPEAPKLKGETHTMNSMSTEAWVCANYQWFNVAKYSNSNSALRYLYFTYVFPFYATL